LDLCFELELELELKTDLACFAGGPDSEDEFVGLVDASLLPTDDDDMISLNFFYLHKPKPRTGINRQNNFRRPRINGLTSLLLASNWPLLMTKFGACIGVHIIPRKNKKDGHPVQV